MRFYFSFTFLYFLLYFFMIESFIPSQNQTPESLQLKKKYIRNSIDEIDDKLYFLIEQRIEYAKQLKNIKKELNEDIINPIREISILSRLYEKGNLNKNFIYNIWTLFFQESYKVQS